MYIDILDFDITSALPILNYTLQQSQHLISLVSIYLIHLMGSSFCRIKSTKAKGRISTRWCYIGTIQILGMKNNLENYDTT